MTLIKKFADVEINHSVGISGEWMLRVSEADGTIANETPWFPNMILDNGLNLISAALNIGTMSIGKGTTAPVVGNTALQTFVNFNDGVAPGGGLVPATQNMVSPYETGYIVGYRFSIGRLNGTFTEIGVGNNTIGTNLFSRALISNTDGSPSSVTVLATQQLDAFYRVNRRPPIVDTSNTVVIGGTTFVVTGRAAFAGIWQASTSFDTPSSINLGNNAMSIGAITDSPVAAAGGATTGFTTGITPAAYVPNSNVRNYSISLPTGSGNFATGIRTILAYNNGWRFQYMLDQPLMKTVTQTLVLNFKVGWGRI